MPRTVAPSGMRGPGPRARVPPPRTRRPRGGRPRRCRPGYGAARRSQATPSLLPEELPWVTLEVAHHLLDVRVQLLARQQLARGALARAQVPDQPLGLVHQAPGL